jgi:hypothetical protein
MTGPDIPGMRVVAPPLRTRPACDCPCHDGQDIFLVVPCCGSLLTFPVWRSEPRDASSGEPSRA